MLSLADNPPMLGGRDVESVAELTGRWWVGRTRSRQEKVLAQRLAQRGVGYFLPLLSHVTVTRAKRRRSLLPMFPCYVFVCGSEEDRHEALTTHCLCQTLEIVDQAQFLRELISIEKALQNRAHLQPYPFAAVGARCRVIAGPFEGVEGIVTARTRVARLVLQVSILGCGASLELDGELLEPA